MNQENDIHRSKPTILRPKVAAAVVTYNHREAALTLLEFLEKNDIPTFITENAGTDGTREAIKKRFSKLSLLESSANLGGCGGFNCAVLAALSTGAEYIVLLDDDVLPESDCIPQLAEFLDSHEEYVFAAPAIYIASSPDTLQETGGGVDFSSGSPIEAWHRFSVNPELPPYLEVHYASACCLMVRAEVIRKTGVMDWNFFIFSDDVDWSLRLRKTFFNQSQSQNKGACVTTAKAVHDFPWAKPFSPMRLYFLQRNGLYLITRHRQSDSLVSLQAALMHLLWRTIYSKVIGDHEVSKTMWQAFSDAWHKRWGKWRQPVQFGVQRKKLDAEYFRKHKIRRVLLDITIENFDREALELIRAFGGKEIRVDVLCDMHRVDVYREKGMFHKVSGRFPGRLGPLKTFPFIARRRYDLVVTDAFMGSRRPTSMAGKRAAFYHAGELLLAANRPLRACLAYVIAPLLGIALSRLIYRRFLKAPALGIPPADAAPLLEQIGIDPGIGQPWTRPGVQVFGHADSLSHREGKVNFPLGPGEETGGYALWCETRERLAANKYRIAGSVPKEGAKKFSVLAPVCDPQPKWLEECIDSVCNQTCSDWELVLVDDASQDPKIRPILESAERNGSIVCFNDTRQGISVTTNRAAGQARGDFLVFLDHDDLLDPYALEAFAQALQSEEKEGRIDILYADEDRFDETRKRIHPGFKPAYSPDKLLATNYIHHPVAIRRELFTRLGGLRSQYDGSQDYDLLLRAVEVCERVVHIPDVLYHMRLHPGSLAAGPQGKPEAHVRGRQAVAEALARRGLHGKVSPGTLPGYNTVRLGLPENIRVSVLLAAEGEADTEALNQVWSDCQCLIAPSADTPLAEKFNALARQADGDVLIFASSQIHPAPGWREALIPHLMRTEIGLAGGQLVYERNRLYSCGLVLGTAGAAGRWHHLCIADDPGYGGWMALTHEVSALPWRFLAIRRDLFMRCGLFDPAFVQQGFDVDLALRLQTQRNLRHLIIPEARAAFVDGYPESRIEPWSREDLALLWTRWGSVIRRGDPYFNPNFSLYDEQINLIDREEDDLRACGCLMAYDAYTSDLLGQRFPGRMNYEL